MEPPLKRQRLSSSNNPDFELYERRSRTHKKLKSRFESIFEKYGKDFSDVGDEFDFTRDEMVVDNGHILNMVDEKDPGDEDEWSEKEAAVSSSDSTEETRRLGVILDSQDFDSSDDDPLGMLEDAIRSKISSFSQAGAVALAESKGSPLSHVTIGMGKGTHTSPSSGSRHNLSVSRRMDTPLRFRDNSSVEEAWRVPALPKDSNVRPGLPSPSSSEQEDSDSSRSASPPGVSIWAPEARGCRSAWTSDQDGLLRYYRTCTDLTFEALCKLFPGRNANSLSKRWQKLGGNVRAVAPNDKVNAWTLDENQLLQRLKTSTSVSNTDIQRQIPRHSSGAIAYHWHVMRQRFVEPPTHSVSVPTDPPTLPIVNHNPPEPGVSKREALDQPAPPDSSHDVVESRGLGSTEAETVDAPIILGDLVSDQSEPHSDDGEFPPGTVIADFEGGEGTQHLLDQSLNPRACLRKPVTLPKIHNNDDVTRHIPPQTLAFNAAYGATKLYACSTHRDRSREKTTIPSRKRKRVPEKGGNYRPDLPNAGPNMISLQDWEALRLRQRYLDGLTYAAPDSRGEELTRNHKHTTDRDSRNVPIERMSPQSPKHGESLEDRRENTDNDVIVISSSPEPPTISNGSEGSQLGLKTAVNITSMNRESTNRASDEAEQNNETGSDEPEDSHIFSNSSAEVSDGLQQPFAQIQPRVPVPCVGSKQRRLDGDRLRIPEPHTMSIVERPLPEQMRGSAYRSGYTPGIPLCRQLQNPVIRPEDWERIRAQVQSQETVPHQKDVYRPITAEPSVLASLRADLPLSENKSAGELASGSRMLAERLMGRVLGFTEFLPAGVSRSGPIDSITRPSEVAIPSPHHNFSGEESFRSDAVIPSTVETLESAAKQKGAEQGFAKDDVRRSTLDVTSPSAEAEASPKGHPQANKPVPEPARKPTSAAITFCQRFQCVEIPMPSPAALFSQEALSPTQENDSKAHRSSPRSLHTDNSVCNEELSGFFSIPGIEDSVESDMRQEHEHGNSQQGLPRRPPHGWQETSIEQEAIKDIENPIAITDQFEVPPGEPSFIEEDASSGRKSSQEVSSTAHGNSPDSDNDEDDLQLSWQPVVARSQRMFGQRTSTGSARRLAFRPKASETEMSDDELSTPSKVIRNLLEMTPVRSLKNS